MNRAKIVMSTLCLAGLVASCTIVAEDEEGIEIRHAAGNDIGIQARADAHCDAFGKTALRVQKAPTATTFFFRSTVSTFRCVPKS